MLGFVQKLWGKASSIADESTRLPAAAEEVKERDLEVDPVQQHQERGEQPEERGDQPEERVEKEADAEERSDQLQELVEKNADAEEQEAEERVEKDADAEEQEEEDEVTLIPGWNPSMTLDVIDLLENGEENEEQLFAERARLFHFAGGEWKDFGVGDAKLIRHKESGNVRFIHRQEKTMKMLANHYVMQQAPYCILKPNPSSKRSWAWSALDCAGWMPQVHQIGLKLASPEVALAFQRVFDAAKEPKQHFSPPACLAVGHSAGSDSAVPAAPMNKPKQHFSLAVGHSAGSDSSVPAASMNKPKQHFSPPACLAVGHSTGSDSSVPAAPMNKPKQHFALPPCLAVGHSAVPAAPITSDEKGLPKRSLGKEDVTALSPCKVARRLPDTGVRGNAATSEGSALVPASSHTHSKDLSGMQASVLVLGLLGKALHMNTNAGQDEYKQLVRKVQDAAKHFTDSDLAERVESACFKPLPRTGRWMSNTPSWHQVAIRDLIRELGVDIIIQLLKKAIEADVSSGSCKDFADLVQKAKGIAQVSGLGSSLPARIEAGAFTLAPERTPNKGALKELLHAFQMQAVSGLLERAAIIDTNLGSTEYKELVKRAQDVAKELEDGSSLCDRIADVAFKPLARTGKWMANTPSCHQAALKELTLSLQEALPEVLGERSCQALTA